MIHGDIPGGNICVIAENGRNIILDIDLRDTRGEWFYWRFESEFQECGLYHFHFARPFKIGPYGPAVSRDGGKSWTWLSSVRREENQSFDYKCTVPGERVQFCQGLPYMQEQFEAFRNEFSGSVLEVKTLCRTRKNRNVELAVIREGNPEYSILLTSRHHAQEMMATHALEGILRAALGSDEFGHDFRKHVALYAVPFVDKDGVEDGDQGKNRDPYDHNRDYQDPPLYPETLALRNLIAEIRPDFVLDMHCPWLRCHANETAYLLGSGIPEHDAAMDRFSDLLEKYRVPEAPYFKRDNLPFGSIYNRASCFAQGLPFRNYAALQPFVSSAQTLEIPFSNFGSVMVDRPAMLRFGGSIARALLEFRKNSRNSQDPRT